MPLSPDHETAALCMGEGAADDPGAASGALRQRSVARMDRDATRLIVKTSLAHRCQSVASDQRGPGAGRSLPVSSYSGFNGNWTDAVSDNAPLNPPAAA